MSKSLSRSVEDVKRPSVPSLEAETRPNKDTKKIQMRSISPHMTIVLKDFYDIFYNLLFVIVQKNLTESNAVRPFFWGALGPKIGVLPDT